MFGTACSPWEVNTAWILCWHPLSTLVLVPARFWAGISSCHSAVNCQNLASLHNTSPCPGWRARRCHGASELLIFPHENEAFWIFWVVLAEMKEIWSVGIEVVWKTLLQTGSLADLTWNLLPMEKNDCSCWEGLLHSTGSWDVPSSHLPAAGSSWMKRRGAHSRGPGALPGRVLSLPRLCPARYLPTEGAQSAVFNIPHLVWVQWSAHCYGCGRAPCLREDGPSCLPGFIRTKMGKKKW